MIGQSLGACVPWLSAHVPFEEALAETGEIGHSWGIVSDHVSSNSRIPVINSPT